MHDAASITCLDCNKTSYSKGDVDNCYCPRCGYLKDAGKEFDITIPEGIVKNALSIWTIYHGISDFPEGYYVARLHIVVPGSAKPTIQCYARRSLLSLREIMESKGLHNIGRYPDDGSAIVESWI